MFPLHRYVFYRITMRLGATNFVPLTPGKSYTVEWYNENRRNNVATHGGSD